MFVDRGLNCIFGERSELISIDVSGMEVDFGERGWEYAYRDMCVFFSPRANLYFSRAKRACANAQSCLPLLTVCKPVFFASEASMCKGSELLPLLAVCKSVFFASEASMCKCS